MKTIKELNELKPESSILTAIKYELPKINRKGKDEKQVLCLCDCGKNKIVNYYSFLQGGCKSCGCLYQKPHNTFFPVVPKIRRCWLHLMDRCYRPHCKEYINYGSKGVVVCEEWKNDYQKFLDWSLVNGWKEGLNLDKDIIAKKLGVPANLYSPERCQWVTPKENQQTKTGLRYYEYNGEELNVSQIVERTGVERSRLIARLNSGMNIIEAIETPILIGVATKKRLAYWERLRKNK